MKILPKLLSLLLLVATLCVSGVYATWQYAGIPTNDVTGTLSLSLTEFIYKPEEVLPGTEEDSKLNVNHQALLEEILYNSKYGLNKSDTIPSNLPDFNDILHCYENKISSGNMNNIPKAGNLGFTITCIRENGEIVGYYLYSFGEFSSYTTGNAITVYRTLIQWSDLENEWTGVSSKNGYVITASNTVKMGKGYYYILPSAWQSGSTPTT